MKKSISYIIVLLIILGGYLAVVNFKPGPNDPQSAMTYFMFNLLENGLLGALIGGGIGFVAWLLLRNK